MEKWKDIEGYEGLYQVSNYGRVKSIGNNKNKKEKILKEKAHTDGYLQITLYKNGKKKTFLIHRLVAQSFIPNPDNYQEINHIDENKKNNFLENLEWCNRKYNVNYGTRTANFIKAKNKEFYFRLVSKCCRGLCKINKE